MIAALVEIAALLVAGVYAALLIVAYIAFARYRTKTVAAEKEHNIAIVVAARNEEQHILRLLNALEAQECDHPFEVVIVDDASEDRTLHIAQAHWAKKFRLHVLRNNGVGKKDALTTGIHATSADIILVTDADCVPGTAWVRRMAEQFNDGHACFVAGTVRPQGDESPVSAALITETVFLQFVSAGLFALKNPALCNGASMAFTRTFFMDVNGFTNDAFASGDDVLLLQKAKHYAPDGIRWVKDKDAMVEASVVSSLPEAMQQRHRWLSKLKAYSGAAMNLVAPLFLCVQLLLPAAVFFTFIYGVADNPVLPALLIKTGVELLLLSLAASFFRATNTILLFPVSAVVYCAVSLGAVLRLMGQDVQWKGRTWREGKVR